MLKNSLFKKILLVFFLIMFSANVFSYIPKSEMKIFAVTTTNQGMDAKLIVEIKPGNGKIFSNVNSHIGSLTQESERNAVLAVEKILPEVKGKYDYFFEIISSASSVDGPSAGAAMTLLIISMHNDLDLQEKVSITGTISSDGFIGDVGGISAKAKKAGEVGIKLFMIPIGTRKQAITNEQGVSQLVDLPEYAYENWGLKIVEVETISDILKYISMDLSEIDVNKIVEKKEESFFPEKIQPSQALLPMNDIVTKYIDDVKKSLKKTEDSINTSSIKDSAIVQNILSLVDFSKEAISSSENNFKNNYLYTAANESFLAKIYLITVDEIVSNPSIISANSTIYNLRLKEIEKKIQLTENRAKNCSLDSLEWCAGAKQRIVWAKNKIDEIKLQNNGSSSSIDKIMNYSYALAWLEIANDFLNTSGVDEHVFVESDYFKDLAQKYIIDLENQLVLDDGSLQGDEDFLRRYNAAKKELEMGWYVTSLYDSATAKAVLVSAKENKRESFDENIFLEKYNRLSELRQLNNLHSTENVWSKMFFDHSLYYYKQYQHFKSKNITKATSYLKTANSIINIVNELYVVEINILNYYLRSEQETIIILPTDDDLIVNVEKEVTEQKESKPIQKEQQSIYVYKKPNTTDNTIIYVFLAGLFIIVLSIAIELNKHDNKKSKIQKAVIDLEHKLYDGKISKFTYEDMKKNYIFELKEIEKKENKKKLCFKEKENTIEKNKEKKIKIEETQSKKNNLDKNKKFSAKESTIQKIKQTPVKEKLLLKKPVKKKAQ